MKFVKELLFLIIHLLLFIKASDSQNISTPEISAQRNLQSNISDNIYNINITGYSLYKNYINIFFYSEPQIPDDLNFIVQINTNRYKYSELNEKKEFELAAEMVDTNKLTVELNKENLLETNNSNCLYIDIKNISIESNDDNIYNIHLNEISFNIILPFYFDTKEGIQTNDSPIIDNIILNKIHIIHIIGYDLIDNLLNLYTYFENMTDDDIYFALTLNIDSFNIIGNYWQRKEINVKTLENIEKNKYTAVFLNLKINEVETHTKITITEINAEPYKGNTIYYVDSSQITFDIKPSRKLELNMTNLAIINQNIYNIYFTEIFLYENKIHLFSYSEPEIFDDIHYLVSFNLDKFNSAEFYWERKKNVLKTTNNINGANEFILNLDSINSNFFPATITITNIKEEKSDKNNIYYIHFPIKSFNIENSTQKSIIQTTIFLDTDITTETDSFPIISLSPNKKTSSSKISAGALIGIIIGVIIVIGGIIFIIIKFFCKNPKKADFPPPGTHGSDTNGNDGIDTSSSNVTTKVTDEKGDNFDINLRYFNFQTQKQMKNTIIIEKNKTLNDLRKLYFEMINRIDLFEDEEIYFLCYGQPFTVGSNEIIETIFKNYKQYHEIIVVDQKDKINKTCPKPNNQ